MVDEPFKPVLLYDGHCAFCRREAARLERWGGGRLRVRSFRDPGVLDPYPGITPAACEQAMQTVESDGRVRVGADAIVRVLSLQPLLAPVGWLYRVPGLRQFADLAYQLVARNRFRLFGTNCIGTVRREHAEERTGVGGGRGPNAESGQGPRTADGRVPTSSPVRGVPDARDPRPVPGE
ncbi:MAG: DUF393 domain-containing protein [Planctomycetes bacterium]|nr:DUF393 domain-containing protein [Planctomycetota bacterium]